MPWFEILFWIGEIRMSNFRIAFVLLMVLALSVSACDAVGRGRPDLPQKVVDAIADESVKYYQRMAPEGAMLIEDARLDLFWGEVLPEDAEDYAQVICFQSEIQFVHLGYQNQLYYQGIVKKPKGAGIPWYVDDATQEDWGEYSCAAPYKVLATPESQPTPE